MAVRDGCILLTSLDGLVKELYTRLSKLVISYFAKELNGQIMTVTNVRGQHITWCAPYIRLINPVD